MPVTAGMEDQIKHVSDTALMVAACRAIETSREDGLVRDPYAERLAGERGMAIARAVPILDWFCFGVGLRSRLMDELLAGVVRGGRIKTVLNLGAGLDTRPWRLELPSGLRWIEADFPEMLEYKAAKLVGEKPRCQFEQWAADLADAGQRRKLFERAGAGPALMITEGLLMYLPRTALLALATEPTRACGVRHWLLDVASEEMMRVAGEAAQPSVENLRPKDRLEGQAILDAARDNGWSTAHKRTYSDNAAAAGASRIAGLAEKMREKMDLSSMPKTGDMSGIYLLDTRTSA